MRLEDYGVNPQPRPTDIGRDLYGGQPHDDAWRTAANARIRRYRFWPSYMWLPDEVKPMRGKKMRNAVHDHVLSYVAKTRGRVVVWDVMPASRTTRPRTLSRRVHDGSVLLPQVTSFVQWGLWAGAHWLAKQGGAMYCLDWTPRPAALAYERLIYHDWWTDTAGKTSKTGAYQTRAFLGDYQVTVARGARTRTVPVSVAKNEDGLTVLKVTAP